MFKDSPEGQTHYDLISEISERIVIDYANLSGRDIEHRAEFRDRVVKHLLDLLNQAKEEQKWHESCPGCPQGHPSFWKTITESSQWREWSKVAQDRGWDISVTEECGWISQGHFQDFLEFQGEQAKEKERKQLYRETREDLYVAIEKRKQGWLEQGREEGKKELDLEFGDEIKPISSYADNIKRKYIFMSWMGNDLAEYARVATLQEDGSGFDNQGKWVKGFGLVLEADFFVHRDKIEKI